MIRTQVYIPDDLHRDAVLFAQITGTNFSTVVREGIKEVMKREKATKKHNWKKFIGAVKGGPRDVASKIDYYLYGPGNPKWAKHW